MSKLDRINKKYAEISIIFENEYEIISDIIRRKDFNNLGNAIIKRKATTKALRCILKLLKIEQEKTVNLSMEASY